MAKRGGFPGGMPGNMTNLMKQAQRMQRQMEEKTKELEEKQYTAAAGGGAVTVTVSGKKEVVSVFRTNEEGYLITDGRGVQCRYGGADRRPWRFRRPFFLTWTITAVRSRS